MFESVTKLLLEIFMTSTLYGKSNLKAFVMLNCEDLEFSLKGVSLVA